jgi:hypothetical protein
MAQRPADPAAPLYRHAVVLQVLATRTGPAARADPIAVSRWRIEEDHQAATQSTGLDARQT